MTMETPVGVIYIYIGIRYQNLRDVVCRSLAVDQLILRGTQFGPKKQKKQRSIV